MNRYLILIQISYPLIIWYYLVKAHYFVYNGVCIYCGSVHKTGHRSRSEQERSLTTMAGVLALVSSKLWIPAPPTLISISQPVWPVQGEPSLYQGSSEIWRNNYHICLGDREINICRQSKRYWYKMTCFNDKIIAVTSGLVLLVMVRYFAFGTRNCPLNLILLVSAAAMW